MGKGMGLMAMVQAVQALAQAYERIGKKGAADKERAAIPGAGH